MITTVFSDYNGTIVADTQICIDGGNLMIEMCGGTPLSRKDYLENFHFPGHEFLIEQGCDPEKVQGYPAIFQAYYEKKAKKCRTRRSSARLGSDPNAIALEVQRMTRLRQRAS